MPKAEDLNPREAAFVDEYLVDGIGAQAAIRAGYSPKAARQQASLLLTKPNIKAALAKAMREQEKRTLITADANLKRLDRLAQKAEGEGDWSSAITASAWIGKHFKSFTDRIEVKDTTPRAERLAAARARQRQQHGASE